VTSVGFLRGGPPDGASRGPGPHSAVRPKGPGLTIFSMVPMPKQQQPNRTPGKKPPAPSVKSSARPNASGAKIGQQAA
jgi:hypothetical protein